MHQQSKTQSNLQSHTTNLHQESHPQDLNHYQNKNIQENQAKSINQEDTQNQSEQPYNCQIIINEECVNQMITVLVEPDKSIWYKGEIIASNRPYTNEEKPKGQGLDIQRFMHYFKLKWKVPTKIHNSGPDMAYFCIRKKWGGGKILHLQENIYKQMFIIDFSKLLTINCDPIQFTTQSIKNLPYLSKFIFKQKLFDLNLTLQANQSNMIYQKSLGVGEKLYIGNSYVIGMSETIFVNKTDTSICLQGPGYVFLQPPSSPIQNQNIHISLVLKIITIAIILIVVLL